MWAEWAISLTSEYFSYVVAPPLKLNLDKSTNKSPFFRVVCTSQSLQKSIYMIKID